MAGVKSGVTDGPVGEPATSYSVIKADSMDEAIEIAKGCPVFLGGAKLSLYETFDAMAMAEQSLGSASRN